MMIDCCAQQRSYEKFFGLLGQVNESINCSFLVQFAFVKHCYMHLNRDFVNSRKNMSTNSFDCLKIK